MLRAIKMDAYSHLQREGVGVYGGSQWWILPDVVIEFILNEYESSKLSEYLLNNVFTPDETYVQIMTMRSPLRSKVKLNSVERVSQNSKTWAYFSDTGKPATGHPYIFTMNEYEKIANKKDCWFARKFDMDEDAEILDLIDRNIIRYDV